MAYRKFVGGSRDRRMFATTAKRMKNINVKPRLARGGIRL